MFFITKFVNKDGKIINLKEAAAAAPEEEKSTSSTGETSDTGAESNETDTNTETNQEDTSTENQEDSNTENNDQQNPESEDMSSDDEMDFGDDTSGDGSTDDTSSSDTGSSTDPEGEEEVDENKKAEEEIFSNLTHDQLDIKHKELKNQYLQLYDMTSEIIDRISSINISEDITFVVDYVSTTLSNLRDMVVDYINDVYKTKSYTENLINYNRFLATLSGINKILEEIDKTEEDKT